MTARGALLLAAGGLLLLVVRSAQAAQNDAQDAQPEGPGGGFDLSGILYEVQNMAAGLRMSAAGLDALKVREGLRLAVYLDTAGKPTIGYGHLIGALENFAGGITEAQAHDLLAGDVRTAENAVAALVSVPLTQDQFDSLCSFCFNVGVSAFRKSTLLQVLNAGDYEAAREQMGRWVYVTSGGVKMVDSGLQNRRGSEMVQFA